MTLNKHTFWSQDSELFSVVKFTIQIVYDVFKLLKQTEETRTVERANDKEEQANEREKNKAERAEEIANLTQSISGLIKVGVIEEVESALKPVQESQAILKDEHSKLAEKVAMLQEQFVSFQSTSNSQEPVKNTSNPAYLKGQASKVESVAQNIAGNSISDIVKAAKKVLGFSPITIDHIENAKSAYDITDEDEAKIAAVKDVL